MSLEYLYIGLLKSSLFGLTEVEQNKITNYRRAEIGPGDLFFLDENTEDIITNAVKIEFPQATNLWGIISHFGIFDSLYNGNLLIIGSLDVKKFVGIGDTADIKIGNLKLQSDVYKKLKTFK